MMGNIISVAVFLRLDNKKMLIAYPFRRQAGTVHQRETLCTTILRIYLFIVDQIPRSR